MAKKSNRRLIAGAVFIALVAGASALVIWIMTNKNETRTSVSTDESVITALKCESSDSIEKPFFSHSSAQNQKHTLKFSFKSNLIRDLSYTYNGVFNSSSVAETASAEFLAKYNKHMGENKVNGESYNPVFSSSKTKASISIYSEEEKLEMALAPIFFMSNEEFSKIRTYSDESLKKIYENKGFKCEYHK